MPLKLWKRRFSLYLLMLWSFVDRPNRIFLTAFLAILVLTALSLGTLGGGQDADMSRYLLPLAPFIFLFAGAGAKNLWLKITA